MTHSIGRFQLLRRLGGGGFGEVFLAEDPTIGRQVAIKLFRPKDENLIAFATSSDEEGLQVLRSRFLNEAKILAALDDEAHVVNVLDFGELADGTPYYVMPYLPVSLAGELGRDVFDVSALEELPAEERPRALPLEHALDVVEQTLKGLAAAHRRGLIHRDIKPGNLMLSESGQIRIVDFGIAKAPDTTHSTVSHLGLGSRNYMAPEQRESAKHVDARADVYAVGVVAYRALTGKLPIGRFADPNVAIPALGKAMNALLLKLLAQDKADRPANATEALAAFQQARKSVGQASASDTGTWAGDDEAGIRDDLKPLRARIAEMLHATGRIGRADFARLQALAAVADLDEAGLNRLIRDALSGDKRLQAKKKLADLIAQQVQRQGRALTVAERETFEEAAQAVAWDRATLEVLSKQAAEELPARNAASPHAATRAAESSRSTDEPKPGKGKFIGMAAVLLVLAGTGFGIYQWRQGQIADAASKQATNQSAPARATPTPSATPSADPQRTRILATQDYLNRLGYRVAETGEADPRTVEAIKRFENEHKLIVTGTPDELVQTELVKEYDRRDAQAWDKATKAHTEAAYLDYRVAFPQGAHINEVDSQRDAAAWVQARKQDTEAAYQRYRDQYPQGAQVAEVDQRIAAVQARVAEEKRLMEEKRKADEKRKAEETLLAEEKRKTEEEAATLARNGGFRDNGDGTLIDSKTGLIWAQRDNGSNINWNNANAHCEGRGMRLPSIEELAGIYDRPGSGTAACSGGTCKASPLFKLTSYWFWSGTQNGSSEAWDILLYDGNRRSSRISYSVNARALCVKRGS